MALIKCPECEKNVSDKASNCPDCGYPIYLSVNDSLEKKKCQFCGIMNEHYANKCSSCGAILDEDIPTFPKEPRPVILQEVKENGLITCGKCSFAMPIGTRICKNCGNNLLGEHKKTKGDFSYYLTFWITLIIISVLLMVIF